MGGDSESINMLRFPLAILVVFVHGFGADIDIAQLHTSGLTGAAVFDYVRLFFSVVISRSAVPIFFIISGYLFFLKVEEYCRQVYVNKLKKRWYSLVIPYFAWNILFMLWTLMFIGGGILLHGKPWNGISNYFFQNGCFHMFWNSGVWGERTTWLGVETHNSGPVLLPFWYMRDLIVMVVLSPVIFWLVRKTGALFIVLLMAVYAFDIRISWMSGTFMAAGLFFSLGSYFSIKKQSFTDVLWLWRYVILPLAIVLIVWQTYSGSQMGDAMSRMIHPWLVIIQSFAIILVASVMCRYQCCYLLNMKLAKTSFFIYAMHPFILGRVITGIHKIMPMSDIWYVMTINYLAAPLTCVGICVGVYWGMRRCLPGVMRMLMGERKTKNFRL